MFHAFPDVETYLNSLINYESRLPLGGSRDRPKLEPTCQAASRLHLPLALANTIHVAGTKGKGSVVSFLEALFAPDYSVLSFSSPHLVSVKERVRWNGQIMDDLIWCEGFEDLVRGLEAEPELRLSYFEMTFVFFLWAAQRLRTQIHVVEAGLGGKWDATNVLVETLPVLTLIDYDHTDILGNTLAEIARDKAGIVKADARLVVGRQPAEALEVIKDAIAANGAGACLFDQDYRWTDQHAGSFAYEDDLGTIPDLTLGVPGNHQRDNAAIALQAARLIDPHLSASVIRQRLTSCVIPGRQQLFPGSPAVLVDVAHNPISFAALAETLRSDFRHRKILAVVGMMKDKDARGCFMQLRGLVHKFLVVNLSSPRSFQPDELSNVLRELEMNATECTSPSEAFAVLHDARRGHDLGVVCGSFYLVGDYLTWRAHAGIA